MTKKELVWEIVDAFIWEVFATAMLIVLPMAGYNIGNEAGLLVFGIAALVIWAVISWALVDDVIDDIKRYKREH